MKQVYSIVGTTFCSPRAQAMLKAVKPGTVVTLVREPDNKFDKNAVGVFVDGERVGYIPKTKNVALGAFIDQEGRDYGIIDLAQDSSSCIVQRKAIDGKFAPSPNSGFPQVEVG